MPHWHVNFSFCAEARRRCELLQLEPERNRSDGSIKLGGGTANAVRVGPRWQQNVTRPSTSNIDDRPRFAPTVSLALPSDVTSLCHPIG